MSPSSPQDHRWPLLFASRGIGDVARLRSHRTIMHIGAICVWAITVRVYVQPSQPRVAVMIPKVVNVPQASLGRLRVPRLDVYDLRLAVCI